MSSTFGDSQGRLSAQQNQASQLLQALGRMVKDLFSLVRELRMIRERLGYYEDVEKKSGERATSAEKTLKGIYIDLVEGGTQSPTSVFGIAQKVGYTVVPDLFFNAPPLKPGDVDKYVNGLEFNENVRTMLKRKLFQFAQWKKETHNELLSKRNFQIRYLRQHFDTIRMYIGWIKPYLRQIEMLQVQHGQRDDHNVNMAKAHMDSGLMINSFQGALIEVETLAYREQFGKFHPCVLFHFFHRSMPSMDFHAKDSWQQKGPIHIGRSEVTIRAYAWTPEQIKKYKEMKMHQDFESLLNIDQSLMDAMRLLGKDLVDFLKEAELELPESFRDIGMDKKEEETAKPMGAADPLVGVYKGLWEMISPMVYLPNVGNVFSKKKEKIAAMKDKDDASKAKKYAMTAAWQTYKNYKKAHGMITW
jgi:hypothetical protein